MDRIPQAEARSWKQVSQFSAGEDWIFAAPVKLGRLPWSADAVNDAYCKAARPWRVKEYKCSTIKGLG